MKLALIDLSPEELDAVAGGYIADDPIARAEYERQQQEAAAAEAAKRAAQNGAGQAH